MFRYRIQTHVALPGVRLSCDGAWGNLPFATDAAAERAAKSSAGRLPHVIVRETCDMPLTKPRVDDD